MENAEFDERAQELVWDAAMELARLKPSKSLRACVKEARRAWEELRKSN